MEKVECSECIYWKKYKNDGMIRGECRQSTPLLSPTGKGVWPTTMEKEFCFSGKKIQEPEMINEDFRP